MLDLGHIRTDVVPLWRVWCQKQVDSFWIHFVRNQFVPSCVNLLFATWMTWTGVMVKELIHTIANSSQINSSKLRPLWSWSVCLCIGWILNQLRYKKTIIYWGFGQHMICWTFRQNVALGLPPRATFCLQVQHIICYPHQQSIIVYYHSLSEM